MNTTNEKIKEFKEKVENLIEDMRVQRDSEGASFHYVEKYMNWIAATEGALSIFNEVFNEPEEPAKEYMYVDEKTRKEVIEKRYVYDCPNCGSKEMLESDYKFCPYCSASIEFFDETVAIDRGENIPMSWEYMKSNLNLLDKIRIRDDIAEGYYTTGMFNGVYESDENRYISILVQITSMRGEQYANKIIKYSDEINIYKVNV